MEENYIRKLQNAGYVIVGSRKHSAVSTCHWTRESIKKGRTCYKEKFYGIKSHRCLQFSPCIYCMQKCLYCWRPIEYSPVAYELEEYDDPEQILEEAVQAQRKLLQGYFGLLGRVDRRKLEEAQEPKQAAISLAGEPTIYPRLGGLVEACRKRGMSTFVVSNGMLPGKLASLDPLPTQLYVSLSAPNEKIHHFLNNPLIENSWKRLQDSLETLKSLDTRKVIRVTLVKGINDTDIPGWVSLLRKAEPDFIEVKAYMRVGYSRQRLEENNMPRHEDVVSFASSMGRELAYETIDEKADSRVVLLSSGEKQAKILKK